MTSTLILLALLGVNPGSSSGLNPKEDNAGNGYLNPSACIRFQNGTREQICSPADNCTNIYNSTGVVGVGLYTGDGNHVRFLNPGCGGTIASISLDDIYDKDAMSADVAVAPNHIMGGKPPMNSTAAAQRTGGSVGIIPGSGLRRLDGVTRAGTAGDTLTFTYCDMELACTSVVLTEGAGAGQWNCAAAGSDIACVCNIYTLITGHATLGSRVTVNRLDGTCSNELLTFGVVPGVTSYIFVAESDSANEPVSDGVEGKVLVTKASAGTTTPSIASLTDQTTGIGMATGEIEMIVSGARTGYFNASGLNANGVGAGDISSSGTYYSSGLPLTAGTMTMSTVSGRIKSMSYAASWTNAMIVALGAVGSGDISVVTLPAKTRVKNMYLIVDTQCTLAAGALTMAVGRTGAGYLDYIADSDIKAAANTVYGDAAGERGANLTGFDLPSYTGTTTVYAHLIAGGGGTMNNVTTCTGHIVIETELVL
jgi:hypothetical protein